ncbi:MAG: OB-fold nucleic acid binding domain-containing protein, partial [Gemmataceae bacterium]
ALEKAFSSAEQRLTDRKRGQRNFFDMLEGGADEENSTGGPGAFGIGVPDVPEWPELEKLKYEKEALDFYITSHPLAQFEDQLRRFATHQASDAAKAKHGSAIMLGGMLTNLNPRTTKTGKRFALCRIEDFSGQIKGVLWSEEFLRFRELIVEDTIAIFEGILEWGDRAEPDFIIKRILTIEDARREFTKGLVLRMNYSEEDETLRKIERLGSVLGRFRGRCPVYLSVRDRNGRAAQFKLSNDYSIDVSTLQVAELEMLLGPGAVVFTR